MRKISLFAIIIAAIILAGSCNDKKPKPEVKSEVDTVVFDTRKFDKWVYFSFEKGTEVTIDDYQNSLDWDIAFHRFDVRLNCGTAGPGKGGSQNMGKVNFYDLKEAPLAGYSLNDSISIVNKDGGWLDQVMVPGDTIIASWLLFSGPPPQYNITNNIFVIKTANEKYAKIWLSDYYNDDAEKGFVTMQYFYQKDGSTKLE